MRWTWWTGEDAGVEDFGDPTESTNYKLCIYDESSDVPRLVVQADAEAGPRWLRLRGRGFHYRSGARASNAGDLAMLTLRSGATGRARITAVGRGEGLHLSSVPMETSCEFTRDPMRRCMLAGDTKVIVQLHQIDDTPGSCWEAVYESPPISSGVNKFFDVFDGRRR